MVLTRSVSFPDPRGVFDKVAERTWVRGIASCARGAAHALRCERWSAIRRGTPGIRGANSSAAPDVGRAARAGVAGPCTRSARASGACHAGCARASSTSTSDAKTTSTESSGAESASGTRDLRTGRKTNSAQPCSTETGAHSEASLSSKPTVNGRTGRPRQRASARTNVSRPGPSTVAGTIAVPAPFPFPFPTRYHPGSRCHRGATSRRRRSADFRCQNHRGTPCSLACSVHRLSRQVHRPHRFHLALRRLHRGCNPGREPALAVHRSSVVDQNAHSHS